MNWLQFGLIAVIWTAISAAIGWLTGGLNIHRKDELDMRTARNERDQARDQRDRLNRANAQLAKDNAVFHAKVNEATVTIGQLQIAALRDQREIDRLTLELASAGSASNEQATQPEPAPTGEIQYELLSKPKRTRNRAARVGSTGEDSIR